ncbi:MAG: zinc-binding dehydrogenase [Candidatus Eisenbacteria bacterium]|nr:zinc-binding dehydrogenase [Candidatus Latescibacterota bacterium]MBD3303375.1 zinc-binding dehydrogenase [Candidatus Eisenbacteria bacterium]
MKVVVNARYGSPDVLEIREVPKPEPRPGEILIRVHATTVTRTDCGFLRASPFFIRFFTGLRRPKATILGMDFAGEVEAVGTGVGSFSPGDRVFGMSPDIFGAHAEYFRVSERGAVATIPGGLPYREAVVCEGAWYANAILSRFGVALGQRILIYGASGAIGTAAVQLAKARGAEVTAVVETKHLDLVDSLGADHVVDYTAEDFTKIGEQFDFVMDAVGKTTFFRCRKLLEPEGMYAATDLGPWVQNPLLTLWSAITKSNRVVFPLATDARSFVAFLRDRLETGEIRAVIDRTYLLDEIADAYRYVETGRKTGIVVVDVAGDGVATEDP